MKTYKGFDKDLKCRGFQYEIGKEYETDTAKACESGFHACENPLDVFGYYPPADSRYCEVEQSGEIDKDSDDSKIASTKIKIGAEIGLTGIIKAGVNFILEKVKSETSEIEESSSGDGAQIGSSGDGAQIGSSGDGARIGSSGYGAQIGSSGYGAQIGSSGDGARIGSSGDGAQIGSSGDGAQIGSSGDGARIGSSGYGAQIGSSGYGAQIGSSGDGARIGSSGDGAQIGSSGDGAQIGSSGDGARIGSSGDGARIGSSGENCVICCAGHGCKVKAKKGSWITLSEWGYSKGKPIPVCVKTEFIDGEKLKADTFYTLKNGEFVEVTDN